MEIELLIFLIVLIMLQVIPSLYSLLFKTGLDKKYNFPIGEMAEAAEVLENYVKIYNPVNLRVNADIPTPAIAEKEFVLINKNKMYQFDLFTNFYMLFQLELSKAKYSFQRQYHVVQNLLFLFQLVSVGLFFIIENEVAIYFLWAAIIFQAFILLSIVFIFQGYKKIFRKTLDVSLDLLNLDDVEYARAKALAKDLQYQAYNYPIVLFRNVFLFFIPG